jgi:hypothetical protein
VVGNGVGQQAQPEIATGAAGDCNAGERVEVATETFAGVFNPQGFYLVLYGYRIDTPDGRESWRTSGVSDT